MKTVERRLTEITAFVQSKVDLAKSGQLADLPEREFAIMLREFNLMVFTTVCAVDYVKKGEGEFRLKNTLFRQLPNRENVRDIMAEADRFYNEVAKVYIGQPNPAAEAGMETRSQRTTGVVIRDLEKINNATFADLITRTIDKRVTGQDILNLAVLAEKLHRHNRLKFAAIVGGIIIIITGVTLVVKHVNANKAKDECDGACTDPDIGDVFAEIPEVDFDSEEVPEASIEEINALAA